MLFYVKLFKILSCISHISCAQYPCAVVAAATLDSAHTEHLYHHRKFCCTARLSGTAGLRI